MTRIALVGAGNIGSRYLQGLSRLDRAALIDVFEPNVDARELSRRRFDEVAADTEIRVEFHDAMATGREFDVAIVATTSAERRHAIEHLLGANEARHLILEKFLFQRESDFGAVQQLLSDRGVSGWVNCPRRLWPGYQRIRRELAADCPVRLSITAGERYGIGTTAIHFLDLLAYLAGHSDFELTSDRVDHEARPSPRSGVVEFTGTLHGGGGSGYWFSYTAMADSEIPLVVDIASPTMHAIIHEPSRRASVAQDSANWEWQDRTFDTPLQSELTASIVADLLDRGSCGLPGLDESAGLHIAVLRPLLRVWRRSQGSTDRLPIS